MSITIETLIQRITEGNIEACYFLVGNQSVLLQETKNLIWKYVSQRGLFVRHSWEIRSPASCEAIKNKPMNLDLFARRVLIELRCVDSLSADTGKQLFSLIEWLRIHPISPVLVISCSDSLQKLKTSPWFKKVSAISELVLLDPPSLFAWPQWIARKLQPFRLSLTKDAMDLFVQCTEGNMPAVLQVIKKLVLIYPNTTAPLDKDKISLVLEDKATFKLYHLTDAILEGNTSRCVRIIQYLKDTQVPEALILGCVMKNLRIIADLREALDRKESVTMIFQKHKVWNKQQVSFTNAMQSFKKHHISTLFCLAHKVDQSIKGIESGLKWRYLQQLIDALAARQVNGLLY